MQVNKGAGFMVYSWFKEADLANFVGTVSSGKQSSLGKFLEGETMVNIFSIHCQDWH